MEMDANCSPQRSGLDRIDLFGQSNKISFEAVELLYMI